MTVNGITNIARWGPLAKRVIRKQKNGSKHTGSHLEFAIGYLLSEDNDNASCKPLRVMHVIAKKSPKLFLAGNHSIMHGSEQIEAS